MTGIRSAGPNQVEVRVLFCFPHLPPFFITRFHLQWMHITYFIHALFMRLAKPENHDVLVHPNTVLILDQMCCAFDL